MEDPRASPRSVRLERFAFGIGLVVLIVLGYQAMPDSAPPPDLDAGTPPTAEAVESKAAPERVEVSATSPEKPLPSSGRLALRRAAIADAGPLVIHLGLPEPSRDGEPRPVRLISQPDHRILEVDGRLSADRSVAAIAVDPDYLEPGVYLVEVRTTEQSHNPVRRYMIIVGD